jgi:uncharacterized membrane protein YqaE (UPF0057 family)
MRMSSQDYVNLYIWKAMSLLRVLLVIIFPPLAVIDRGCGSVLIVFLLTLCAWVPGVIGALIILNRPTYYEP